MVHVNAAVWAGIVIAFAGALAWFTRQPFIFPSLGATAYLCATAPHSHGATPKAVFVSHLMAAVMGYSVLRVLGLADHAPAAIEGVTGQRIAAVSLAVALTVASTSMLKSLHPPAGATALIVTLGILSSTHQLTVLLASILMFTVGLMVMRRFIISGSQTPAPVPISTRDISVN